MSLATDFDFFHGAWSVQHCRLARRLAGCNDWQRFGGQCTVVPLLGGQGNVDDNLIDLPGGAYRAATLRAFDPATRQWSIWWLDGRAPAQLGVPMVGGFDGHRGVFHADELFEGRPIRVRFVWTAGTTPRWEQAFSQDGGASWETNWTMDFSRLP